MLNNQRVTFINMKNFPLLDENGKEWWISRSIAVTGCVFTFLNGKWCVLANKRGEGTPDFQGMWNMPCGYLDFNETTAEAVIREVYEETGVRLNPNFLHFWKFNDSPAQNRQNVSFRYYALIDAQPGSISVGTGNDRGGEEDEVEAIGGFHWTLLININGRLTMIKLSRTLWNGCTWKMTILMTLTRTQNDLLYKWT